MLPSKSVPDVKEKRRLWKEHETDLPIEDLIFLDESGVNLGMVRRYGRAIGGQRVVDHSPINKPQGTTLLSAIRADGVLAQISHSGGTTKERFLKYVQEILVPALNPGEIVIMDNLAAHHAPQIAQLLQQAGGHLLYLPPYSPDFNPIEKL